MPSKDECTHSSLNVLGMTGVKNGTAGLTRSETGLENSGAQGLSQRPKKKTGTKKQIRSEKYHHSVHQVSAPHTDLGEE